MNNNENNICGNIEITILKDGNIKTIFKNFINIRGCVTLSDDEAIFKTDEKKIICKLIDNNFYLDIKELRSK